MPEPLSRLSEISVLFFNSNGCDTPVSNIRPYINGYLAALGDTLFRDTCIGDGASNAVLSDVAIVTMGQSPAGSSYNEVGNGEVFYQGRGEFGWRFPRIRLFTTEAKRMATASDVLMSVRAPLGDLNVAYEDCCIGHGIAAIHCDWPSFCLYLMRSLQKELNTYNGEGTDFGSINGKALKALPIFKPNEETIRRFEHAAEPINAAIRNNEKESRNLEQLRDTLLPKLMSGEVDVSDTKVTVNEGER